MPLDTSILVGFCVVYMEGNRVCFQKGFNTLEAAQQWALSEEERYDNKIISVCAYSDLLRLPPWTENVSS